MNTRASVGVVGLIQLDTSDDTLGRELGKHPNNLDSFHR
jgi:hypothetical protein